MLNGVLLYVRLRMEKVFLCATNCANESDSANSAKLVSLSVIN